MHVGVFPLKTVYTVGADGLPHARGGVSIALLEIIRITRSSPCTWGCFQSETNLEIKEIVFPMHVGVFPAL